MKAFIFDLDGVLVHTDHFHYLAWKNIADQEDIYFDEIINDRLRGVSRMDSLEIILENAKRIYSMEEKSALAFKKNEIYKNYLATMTTENVSFEVKETLLSLKENGYLLAVGSSSKNAKLILEQTSLTHYFRVIVDGNDIEKSKPDPEVFLIAGKRLAVLPSECYVIEDATAGIDAANRGGFISVGYQAASRYPEAQIKIIHISDLLNLI